MMVIPADLLASLVFLAWMLGTWKGWGMRSGFDEAEGFAVIEGITGTICGEQMLLITSIYRDVPKAGIQIDPVWDVTAGLANIARRDLIFKELMHVSVLPDSGVPPKPGEYVPREFIATSATTSALGILQVGVGVDPRVQMASDAITHEAGAQKVGRLGRMYGLVAGELMWTQERTLASNEAEVEMPGRPVRVVQATIKSGGTVEGINTEAKDGLGE